MISTHTLAGISIDSNANSTAGRSRSRSKSPVGRIDPIEEKLAVWGEPKFHVRDISAGQFGFQLRSRVNTPILSGGPVAAAGDLQAAASAVLAACTREDRLRVDRTDDGFVVSLVNAQGEVIGCTDLIETEALVRAMIRLIVVQAQSATVVLPPIGLSNHLQLSR